MENTKECFFNVVQRICSNWTALKLAVEHGMGSKTMAVELIPYITEVIYSNEGISACDIAYVLEEFMEENFCTELQDDSPRQVAEDLIKFYRFCMSGDERSFVEELEKLPALQQWIIVTERTVVQQPVADSSDSESEAEMEVVDDGWTEVCSKSRRNRK